MCRLSIRPRPIATWSNSGSVQRLVKELERAVPRAQRARLGGRATNSAEPLEYDGLEDAALPVRLNFIAV